MSGQSTNNEARRQSLRSAEDGYPETAANTVALDAASNGRLELIEEAFAEFLSREENMPKLFGIGTSDFSLQVRKVVVQQISQNARLVVV